MEQSFKGTDKINSVSTDPNDKENDGKSPKTSLVGNPEYLKPQEEIKEEENEDGT
jgi:hypothetical protein